MGFRGTFQLKQGVYVMNKLTELYKDIVLYRKPGLEEEEGEKNGFGRRNTIIENEMEIIDGVSPAFRKKPR
jgi:hypothetical protein